MTFLRPLSISAAASMLALTLGAAPAWAAEAVADAAPVNISRDPTDLPAPIGKRAPKTVEVNLEAVEVKGKLADGASYNFWTFNGKVPGPMVRVRVGDTVKVNFKNADNSMMNHSVDFHAVTGPGGGMPATDSAPGASGAFTFKALNPGLYVYHCATPMVSLHIASGMYGMILVEPEEGLPKVDHEFYVMQGEIYTDKAFGMKGHAEPDIDKLVSERPEYFVFNGAAGALKENPLKAKTGETVRVFFGVGGPNYTSSFHVIGEIFDKVYPMGSLTSTNLKDVQTVTVAPGGATIADFKVQVPGNYVLVDHALSRVERGIGGILKVEGPENPEIYKDLTHQKSAEFHGH